MSDADTIRAEIEETRQNLGSDVDALAEKVSPSAIAQRQTDKVKDRVRSARESVMGAVHSAGDALPSPSGSGSGAVDAAKGHPLVVGLIAFGAGWLLSSLIPTGETEQGLAVKAKEKAAPLVDAAKGAAQDAAQQLKEPAMDAASHVKDTATDAAATVKDEGQGAVDDVKGQAADAKDTMQSEASDAKDDLQSTATDAATS
jgi:hypothetical protein